MTHPSDPDGPVGPGVPIHPDDRSDRDAAIDDLTLAGLVRDVAQGWHLPPRRLDEPSWSDRVDPRRVGRRPGGAWLPRLAGALVVAVVATVALSLGAVWLGQPRGGQGGVGASPAGGSPVAPSIGTPGTTASPSVTPEPSQLPVLAQHGAPPAVTSILVRAGAGDALVDLTTGTIGSQVGSATGGAKVVRRSDGTLACLCIDTDGYAQGAYTHATVSFKTYDPAGRPLSTRTIADFTGTPDPRPAAAKDQPPHVDTITSVSPDGRLGFVGWTARQPPLWHAGLVVVDMTTGLIVANLDLPDVSTGADTAPVQAMAPRVAVSPSSDRILVTATSYHFEGSNQDYHETSSHRVATIDGSAVGALTPFAPTASCAGGQGDSGIAADGSAWIVCWNNNDGTQVLRRIGADGSVLGDTPLDPSGEGQAILTSPDGSAVWSWAPMTRMLSRVDLGTGLLTTGTAPEPTASQGDWLTALGRWLAPAARAKVFLDPGFVLSPDGSRVYALGISGGPSGTPFTGSAGIFVFDAKTLAPIAHWPATADYVSIALGPDGRSVYAAGAPGVDARGAEAPFDASITVHDAADGSVSLVAGRLGSQTLLFAEPLVR